MLRQLPPGTLPPQIINFSASSVPILQLGISGEGLSEAQLNDYATNFIRTQLITVPGAVVPSPYGGKQRQISVNMDQAAMQSKGIAPGDVLKALALQSVVMPSGTIKIGQSEYDVRTNGSPRTVEALANIPIKQVNGTTIYLRDVCQRQRRISGADQHRAPGRPSWRAGLDPEERQCLDARCRQGNPGDPAARGEHGAATTEDDAAVGPEHLRPRRGAGSHPRGRHCGRADSA